MMNFWTFAMSFFSSFAWGYISSCLAVFSIMAGAVNATVGAINIANKYHWAWNLLYVPAVIILTFFVSAFFFWSGSIALGA